MVQTIRSVSQTKLSTNGTVVATSQTSFSMCTPKDMNITKKREDCVQTQLLSTSLLTYVICNFLQLPDVLACSRVNSEFFKSAQTQEWVKINVLQGGLTPELRKEFWMHGAGKVRFLQAAVVNELQWRQRTDMCKIVSPNSYALPKPVIEKEIQNNENDEISVHRRLKKEFQKLGHDIYHFLVNGSITELVSEEIKRDVSRTYPTHPMFQDDNSDGKKHLYEVLHALVCLDPAVGYCQGMSFVVAGLLIILNCPIDTFWMALVFLRHFDYSLIFSPDVPLVALRHFQFSRLVRIHFPDLWEHLEHSALNVDFFSSQWFLTAFAYFLDPNILAAVWDAFLISGWEALFKMGLTILEAIKPTLLKLDAEGIMIFFQNSKRVLEKDFFLSGEKILQHSQKHKITQETLVDLEQDFRVEKLRAIIDCMPVRLTSSMKGNDNFPAMYEHPSQANAGTNEAFGYKGPGCEKFVKGHISKKHDFVFLNLVSLVGRDLPLQDVPYYDILHPLTPETLRKSCFNFSLVLSKYNKKVAKDNFSLLPPSIMSLKQSEALNKILNEFESLKLTEPLTFVEKRELGRSELYLPGSLIGGTTLGRVAVFHIGLMQKCKLLMARIERQMKQDSIKFDAKILSINRQMSQIEQTIQEKLPKIELLETEKNEAQACKHHASLTLQTLVKGYTGKSNYNQNCGTVQSQFKELSNNESADSHSDPANKSSSDLPIEEDNSTALTSETSTISNSNSTTELEKSSSKAHNGEVNEEFEADQYMINACMKKVMAAEANYDISNQAYKSGCRVLEALEDSLSDLKEMKELLLKSLHELSVSQNKEQNTIIVSELLSKCNYVPKIPINLRRQLDESLVVQLET